MAATQAKVQEQDSGLMDLLKIFSSQMGTGTQTTTTTPDAGVNANANSLLASIQGGANPEFLQQMAAQIIDMANQKVAPAIQESVGAGNRAYTDTTLQDTAARARAYAAQAMAEKQLAFINDSNRTAASLVGSQLQASKTQTQKTSASPLGKVGQVASTAMGVYGLAKKAQKALPGAVTGLKELLGSTGSMSISDLASMNAIDFAGLEPASSVASASGMSDFVNVLGDWDTASSFSEAGDFINTLGDWGGSTLDFASAAGDAWSGVEAADAAFEAWAGADIAVDAAGAGVPWMTIANLGLNEVFGYDGGVMQAVDDTMGYVGDAITDIIEGSPLDTVICTELHRQGIMPKHIFAADKEFGRLQSRETHEGYKFWAKPLVSLMQKSSLATSIVAAFAMPWAEHMAFKMGATKKDNFFGKVLMNTFLPVCTLIGKMLRKPTFVGA